MSRDRDETTDQGPRVSVQPSGVSVSDPLMHNAAWTKSISDFNVIVKAEFQQRSGGPLLVYSISLTSSYQR